MELFSQLFFYNVDASPHGLAIADLNEDGRVG
ncbi:hypothetical protein MHYMCMPSP_00332 [Hyalomma marginatum]|uniref:Uncharacterized protein n=1 Tax=Hyalomma marginatum TaxID=34627 RepID=A0A8S4C565_9ACAR|nr:hypothetical protein MHYMCMPSP_00332 [Hyalomma marginatum]CAG7599574.1 hypothetical protein MHYMCMPASI_01108 [Hyalomma marginatum]